jgi:uncharacterized membrane protein
VVGAMLLYAAYISAYSAQKHWTFQTTGYDLSLYIQSLWNTLHGDFLRLTIAPGVKHFLSWYFTPSVVLLTPVYALWPSPVTLLIVQSVVVALGAWPIFQLVKEHLGAPWLAAGYACVYLMFPALLAANVYDFHGITLTAPLLIWTWYLAQRRRWTGYGVVAVVTAGFREEAALMLLMMGLLLIADPGRRKAGIWTVLGSAIWFAVLVLVAVPMVRATSVYMDQISRFGYLGNSPAQVLTNLVAHPELALIELSRPEKIGYLLHLFAPVGYLSMFAPVMLLPVLPTLLMNLMAASPPAYSPVLFQYNAPLPPFIVLAAAMGSSRLAGWIGARSAPRRRLAQVALFAFVLLMSVGYQLKLSYLPFSPFFRWPQITAHHQLGWQIAESIPPDAIVSAQNQLAPHVSNRRTVYVFPYVADADYVFLDSTLIAFLSYTARDAEQVERITRQLLSDPCYTVVLQQDGYLLLKRIAD